MAKYKEEHFFIDGQKIPLRIYEEVRSSARISVGKKYLILRLPRFLTKAKKQEFYEWAKSWFLKQYRSKEAIRLKFQTKLYSSGQEIKVLDRVFRLSVDSTTNKSHSARLVEDVIQINIVEGSSDEEKARAIPKLVSRVVGKVFLPWMTDRVHYYNEKFFKKDIKSVRLKYNKSNWGSCSNKSNINFSTRLLLAPMESIDYVIVHELAHLIEMNHSPKFWNIVAQVMPDYKKHDQWLNKYGHTCDF